MEHITFFFKGLMTGLFLCAPFGPIGIICVRRTIAHGKLVGLLSVLGASTVDALYCVVAGLGTSYISTFLSREKMIIQLAGGLVLVLVGIIIFRSRPEEKVKTKEIRGLFGAYRSTFLLMMANPLPILVFTAAFAAIGVQGWHVDASTTFSMVFGVSLGSALWAPILVLAVSFFGLQFNHKQMVLLNRIAGGTIVVFGVVLAVMAVFRN